MLCTMGPSTLSTRAPYLGFEIQGLGTQADSGRTLKPTPVAPSSPLWRQLYLGSEIHGSGTQVHYGGNHTLGLKSMAQVLKPTPVAQAHSGGTSRR
jgi:hypothetical protein